MKGSLLLLKFSVSAIFIHAQSVTGADPLTTLYKIELGPGGIGVSSEFKLGQRMTALLGAGAGGGYSIAEGSVEYTWSIFQPAFYFTASPRLYYNRDKRAGKDKSTKFNAGNYIGMAVKFATGNTGGDPGQRPSMLVNGHWGMQRSMGKKWVFDTHFGAGYAWDTNNRFGTIYPALELKFSYVLNN